jgi:two-component system, LytTR family, response regulator
MRILIVDDEAPARARLRRLLQTVSDTEVVGEANAGDVAVESIAKLTPDLVLLDIQMPRLDGFGVIDVVGIDQMPATIFCTAFNEHALRAFDARAVDYLLKPVQPERLAVALERARALVRSSRARKRGMRSIADLVESHATFLPRLLVHTGTRAHLLAIDSVDHIRAERNYCTVRSAGKSFQLRRSLASLEPRLDPARFLRIGKSDVVRLSAVSEIQPWSHGDYRVVMRDGTTLTWSRRYRAKSEGRELGE